MNQKHFEFLALQVAALKPYIDSGIFKEAYKAVEIGEKALGNHLDQENESLANNTEDSANHVGQVVEGILQQVAMHYGVKVNRKDSVGNLVGQINVKSKDIIPKRIQFIMSALYEYRNSSDHYNPSDEISFEELLMLLQSLLVLLEWYASSILKETIDFHNVIKKSNLEKYRLAYTMAIADGTVQAQEREYLDNIANELSIPPESARELEKELSRQNPNTLLHCEQTICFEDIYPTIQEVEKIIVDEYKTKGEVECLNIALDMEVTWPFFEKIFDNSEIVRNMRYAGLIINPDLKSNLLPDKWRRNIRKEKTMFRGERLPFSQSSIFQERRPLFYF